MSDNLVQLQASYKPIRNPFGFDFMITWNKQPVHLKGDGQWYRFIGALADHVVYHLSTKVANAWHDRQVELAQDQGNEKLVKKLKSQPIPDYVRNKIHIAITGMNHPRYSAATGIIEQVDMDLSVLDKTLSEIQSMAAASQETVNVDGLLKHASDEALSQLVGNTQQVQSVSGVSDLGFTVDPNAGSLPTQPLEWNGTQSVPAQPVQTSVPPQSEFGELRELN